MKKTKEIFPKDAAASKKIHNITVSCQPDDVEPTRLSLAEFNVDELFPPLPDSSYLLVGTGADDFMASRIAHAVEDADANLINMNVTRGKQPGNRHIIHLRVSHRNTERVARSLERYGYNVLRVSDDEDTLSDLSMRHEELMHYLSI